MQTIEKRSAIANAVVERARRMIDVFKVAQAQVEDGIICDDVGSEAGRAFAPLLDKSLAMKLGVVSSDWIITAIVLSSRMKGFHGSLTEEFPPELVKELEELRELLLSLPFGALERFTDVMLEDGGVSAVLDSKK